jgi:predicted nucleic acid-binding Zn finger protein
MTYLNSHFPLVLTVLQRVTTDRLQRAVNALADSSPTVTLTRQSEAEIRALVRNGQGKEYGVVLGEAATFCSCPDSLYRGVCCKHQVVVALYVLRTPQAKDGRIHLSFGTGQPCLCGVIDPPRVWLWPYWPETAWKEACTDCEAVRKQPISAKATAAAA